jgi:hypothetical protein
MGCRLQGHEARGSVEEIVREAYWLQTGFWKSNTPNIGPSMLSEVIEYFRLKIVKEKVAVKMLLDTPT